MMKSSDKMLSTEEGTGKPIQYSCLENPMNSMKRQKDRTLKDELPRLVDAQYATGKGWRNNSRKNEEMELLGSQKRKKKSRRVVAKRQAMEKSTKIEQRTVQVPE